MLKVWLRKYLQFQTENVCLSKPVGILSQMYEVIQSDLALHLQVH